MKHLLTVIVTASVLLACSNDKKAEETSAKPEEKKESVAITYPYTAAFSSDFSMGDANHSILLHFDKKKRLIERFFLKDREYQQLFLYRISCIQYIHILTLNQPEIFTKIFIGPFTLCSFSQVTEHFGNRNIG